MQPTLFDEIPATFYKTINLPADELRAARESNNVQNTRVLAIFEKHPEGLTPFEASGLNTGQPPKSPLTSVRGAFPAFKKSGGLKKRGAGGGGGKENPNPVWREKFLVKKNPPLNQPFPTTYPPAEK